MLLCPVFQLGFYSCDINPDKNPVARKGFVYKEAFVVGDSASSGEVRAETQHITEWCKCRRPGQCLCLCGSHRTQDTVLDQEGHTRSQCSLAALLRLFGAAGSPSLYPQP